MSNDNWVNITAQEAGRYAADNNFEVQELYMGYPGNPWKKFGADSRPMDNHQSKYRFRIADKTVPSTREGKILNKLLQSLKDDGHAFWLPEFVIVERNSDEALETPSYAEFLNILEERLNLK